MTKARDISSLIGSSGQIDNTKITLDANEIPALDSAKITTGNFDASRIGSGTFADARIASSNVSQHATSFDDNKIVNDISTLAIRQASNENKGAYNTNSMFVDVFQDSTGITNLTNTFRNTDEYINSINLVPKTKYLYNFEETSGTNFTNGGFGGGITTNPLVAHGTASKYKFGGRSMVGQNNNSKQFSAEGLNYSGDFTFQVWVNTNGVSNDDYYFPAGMSFSNGGNAINLYKWRSGYGGGYWVIYRDGGNNAWANNGDNAWWHWAVTRSGDNMRTWINGSSQHSWTQANTPLNNLFVGAEGGANCNQYLDGFAFDEKVRTGFETSNSSITVPTSMPTTIDDSTVNATGSFESNAITASSSTNKMGAIITYQDNAGTNTLNTDVVLKLSADGGSNYATATMTAMPDFASGIKMAKVNDLAVTAGTSLKYKIEFANQSASKEARIRGVSLQY